jgi:D-cysteine desulfhydrase family pyridoxal phosphate-dependent enzyme
LNDSVLAQQKYNTIPRKSLVNLYTPIERCKNLQEAISGSPNIYIKRDDFIGYFVGGNKIRKLEYVMADVIEKKSTATITVGSVQSNHARTTAMVAKRLGIQCVLVLNGEMTDPPVANSLINKLLNVKIHTVKTRDERNEVMAEIAKELEEKGERVYKIPLGASDEIGSFGFVAAYEEILSQQKKLDLEFDAIILSSSSGGTQAGLEIGKRLFNKSKVRIIGISADEQAGYIKNTIAAISKPMLSRLGLKETMHIEPSSLDVDDGYVGDGYGCRTPKSDEAEKLFIDTEGILLDQTYTSKAAAALIEYCRQGMFDPKDNVLFWHTGGLLKLFV